MRVRVEFTTEPFQGEGELPEHVSAAADRLTEAGLEPDLGPLGTAVEGDAEAVLGVLGAAIGEALEAGATRVTLQLERADGHA
jgi:uncharacterized protein YqgV (UPF0045/DUF77 family)